MSLMYYFKYNSINIIPTDHKSEFINPLFFYQIYGLTYDLLHLPY